MNLLHKIDKNSGLWTLGKRKLQYNVRYLFLTKKKYIPRINKFINKSTKLQNFGDFKSPGIICEKYKKKHTAVKLEDTRKNKFKFVFENFPHTSWQFIKLINKYEYLFSVTKYFHVRKS